MATRQYFIGYAKESIDGTTTYGVDVCDEKPEDHVIDVSDPGIYIDVHVQGRLDDPISLLSLGDFLKEHNLGNLTNYIQKPTPCASEEAIESAFEDTESATEAGFKDAVKNIFAKQSLNNSERETGNLKPKWNANLAELDKAINTGVFKQASLTDIEAARCLAAAYTEGVDKMYVCYQTHIKKGTSERQYKEIAQQVTRDDAGTDKERDKLVLIVKDIRAQCNGKEIAGYTFDLNQAKKWENSLSDDAITEGGSPDVDADGEVSTDVPEDLETRWKSAKSVRERLILLQRYLKGLEGFDASKVADDVLIGIANKTNFKDSWAWKALSYVIANKQGFDAGVYKAINESTEMQKELFGGKSGLRIDGLDFGKQTQFAVIRAALGTEFVAKLYKKNQKKWIDGAAMATLYKENNKFTDARAESARRRQADRNTESPAGVADTLAGMSADQLSAMLAELAGKNPEKLKQILAAIGKK